jgi:hypothetical protein
MDNQARREQLLERRLLLTEGLVSLPYDLIIYLERAVAYSDLGYPDLAAGDAYRALLLTDEVANDGFEYHDQAMESLLMRVGDPLPEVLAAARVVEHDDSPNANGIPTEGEDAARQLAVIASVRAYQILSLSLLLCGCLKSAASF